jgi:hypothetical protein
VEQFLNMAILRDDVKMKEIYAELLDDIDNSHQQPGNIRGYE